MASTYSMFGKNFFFRQAELNLFEFIPQEILVGQLLYLCMWFYMVFECSLVWFWFSGFENHQRWCGTWTIPWIPRRRSLLLIIWLAKCECSLWISFAYGGYVFCMCANYGMVACVFFRDHPPPTFGSSSNLEALALQASESDVRLFSVGELSYTKIRITSSSIL